MEFHTAVLLFWCASIIGRACLHKQDDGTESIRD
jgi:hypothetical protein